MQEIVVTGSRIKGITNADSPSAISVTTAEEISLTKATSIEDVLSRMIGPDFTGGVSNGSNNGGNGLSQVGLRNLGPSRTLILIDGQRLIPIFAAAASVVDLNAVPLAMVERIEVLRDGASSIYGADAIGGVINIITKKNADGATFDASYGRSSHNDGKSKTLAGSIGVNSDKGNALVAVTWDHSDPIEDASRNWAVDPHIGAKYGEGGSAFRSQLNTLQDQNSNSIWINGTQFSLNDPNAAALLPHVAYLTGSKKTKLNAGSPGWNYLTQGLDRKQISLNAHYDLSENVKFIAEGFFTDRTSQGSLRPEPLLGDTISTTAFAGFFVPSYAPGNTTGTTFSAFLTPEQFGPRRYESESQTYRIRTGFEGKIGTDFNWEAGFVDQHNATRTVIHNTGNFNHLGQITGQINCIDVPGGCSNANAAQLADNANIIRVPTVLPNFFNGPYNIFTQAQVNYLKYDNTDVNVSTERYAYADINGSLFTLPAGSVRGALGVEHRNEFLSDNPDILVQEGFGPNQTQTTAGGYNVSSVYGELSVPILKDAPFAKMLTINPSARYDKYSSFGDARTYKFGVEFTATEDIRFRGSYSTGFRAPSVAELFGGQAISDITANGDPCDTRAAGFNGNSNVGLGVLTAGSQCSKAVAGGGAVTNFQSGNNNQTAQQQQVLIGGSPKLKPEKSNNWGAGFVLTPRFTPGLSFAVDYYNIRISNTVLTGGIVGATSVDTVLLGCYGAQQNQQYCDLIRRNAAGTISQVNSLNDNFGVARVTGTDYQLTYDTGRANMQLPFPGSIHFDLQVSQQYHNSQTNADGSVSLYNGQFQYSIEALEPRFKGLAALDYTVGPWTAHWDTRFYEHTVNFDGSKPQYGNVTPNIYYHSISAAYSVNNASFFKNARFVLGVNNLFDKDPPFLNQDSICKCNTLAGPFDVIGRFYFGRVSLKF